MISGTKCISEYYTSVEFPCENACPVLLSECVLNPSLSPTSVRESPPLSEKSLEKAIATPRERLEIPASSHFRMFIDSEAQSTLQPTGSEVPSFSVSTHPRLPGKSHPQKLTLSSSHTWNFPYVRYHDSPTMFLSYERGDLCPRTLNTILAAVQKPWLPSQKNATHDRVAKDTKFGPRVDL